MKRVTDKQSVAHLWANQEQDEARTATGNLYFNYNGIFSYGSHFMIAKHVTNQNGANAVLMTRRTYSQTTSGQVSIVKQASNHIKQIYVPDPDRDRDWLMEKWYAEIKEIARLLNVARKPGKYILQIQQVFDEAKTYADFFGIELPEYLIEAGEIQNAEQYTDVIEREIAYRKAEEEKRQTALAKVQKAAVKRWRIFEIGYLKTYDGWDYLRYNATSERVETSQRIEIPEGIARKFYALVLETIGKGGCTDCKAKLMDRYDVLAINKTFIQVGCHKISLKEIKAFTKKMGW